MGTKQKKLRKLILVVLVPVLLTGCWDFKDIDEYSILLAMGVDLTDDGKIEYAAEIAALTSAAAGGGGGGGGGQGQRPTNVYRAYSQGETFEEARLNLDKTLSFHLFLGATRTIVFGENFARNGIQTFTNRIDKIVDFRKTLAPVVSRENPREIINVETDKDISVGFVIEDIMVHLEEDGAVVQYNVGDIITSISHGDLGFILPYIGIEKNGIEYLGIAVFKHDKMIDTISIEETDGIMYLLSPRPTFIELVSLPENNNPFNFEVHLRRKKIKTDYKNEKVIINIDLDFDADLQHRYYIEPIAEDDIEKYEKAISEKIKKDIIKIIEKTQKEYETDIFKFAKHFRAQNPKIYEEIDWMEKYPDAEITVNVDTTIIHLGDIDIFAKKKIKR